MYKKLVSAMYVLNIVAQAIFTLLTPPAILFLVSYLLIKYCSLDEWIYAVAIPVGMFLGIGSMVKFILAAMRNLDRIEEDNGTKQRSAPEYSKGVLDRECNTPDADSSPDCKEETKRNEGLNDNEQ